MFCEKAVLISRNRRKSYICKKKRKEKQKQHGKEAKIADEENNKCKL